MAKRWLVYKSIRHGVRGPRLRLHMFYNGVPDWSLIFTPNETAAIYNMIGKNLNLDTSIKTKEARQNISRKGAKAQREEEHEEGSGTGFDVKGLLSQMESEKNISRKGAKEQRTQKTKQC